MKKILSVVLSLAIVSGLFGAVGASAAPADLPVDPVDQLVLEVLPKDIVVPADFLNSRAVPTDSVSPFAETDTPLNGAYSYARYKAAGGRVDIEMHQIYLNPMDARAFARESETSIFEGIVWFGASFIPAAGPYLATLGLLKTVSDANFVSSIRQYADVDQGVMISIYYDRWYGTTSRGATYWNGMKDSVKANDSISSDYLISSYVNYKY